MKIFVLTGSIAMGKTTIANIFKGYNIEVFCADEYVHFLYRKAEIIEQIKGICPAAVNDNIVSREILAKYFLQDNSLRKKIEDLIHRLVFAAEINFIEEQKRKKAKLALLDLPLYLEKNHNRKIGSYDVDKILLAHTDLEQQKARALSRENMTEDKFNRILRLQLPTEYKINFADYVIDTSLTIAYTKKQIENILQEIGII